MNDAINEEWISDKTRHVWDGLRMQRLDRPLRPAQRQARAGDLGRGLPRHRREAEGPRRQALRGHRRRSRRRRGDVRAEAAHRRSSARPISIAARTARKLDPALGRATYLFNATIEGIEQADAILLVGTNPRVEAAGAQCPHPQALAPDARAPPHRADRRGSRPHLCLRLSRRRPRDPRQARRRLASFPRKDEGSRAAAADRRPGSACAA